MNILPTYFPDPFRNHSLLTGPCINVNQKVLSAHVGLFTTTIIHLSLCLHGSWRFLMPLMMVLCVSTSSLKAQAYAKRLERANALYEEYSYMQAIPVYEKLLKRHPHIAEAQLRLAECYRLTKRMDEAEKWYRKAADMDVIDSIYLYHFASVLKYNRKYEEAKDWYLRYEAYKLDGRGYKQAKFLDLIHYFVRDSSKVDIRNMGFNTEHADFSPAFFKEGLLYVSSQTKGKNPGGLDQWTGENFLDLYYIEKVNIDSSGKAKRLPGFINSNFHEGPSCFDSRNDVIYFTRNTIEKGVQKRSRDGVLKIQIYLARQVDNRWDLIEKFPLNNPDYIFCHPSLSADGSRIFFASDMPGGYGGLDIYYANREGEGWGLPVNLGPHVNTLWNEAFPYIHSTGTLYFASDGLPGLGGFDVYSVRFGGKEWTDVKNLGYPINTSYDDFGFILDSTNKSGYVSSNRRGGKGGDDIYSVFIKDVYFEEGVLLTTDEEMLKESVEAVNDFGVFEDAEDLPAEAFQPAVYDSIAGLAVIPADDVMLEALSMQLFKPDYQQEEELAKRVMKDERTIEAEARRVQRELAQRQQQTPATATPVKQTTDRDEESKSLTAMGKARRDNTDALILPSVSAQQLERMKDSKGRLILDRMPQNLKSKTKEGLIYRIQVGAYRNPLRLHPDKFFRIEGIETYDLQDGITRYLTPMMFADIQSAEVHKRQVVLRGHRDAFIVPFYNGRRITPEEVLRLLHQ